MKPIPLQTAIQNAIANPNLQAALDGNAQRRVNGRLTAFASLPDWRERHQRAHAVRAEVIENLEQQLQRFCQQASANGLIVHRAADASQALKIVLEIVEAQRKTPGGEGLLIAKSKSMISEEIELNHALEAAGHRVVETDLGEYIIQLRGERPSHLIAPAVHLRRADVGKLFHEKLGIPYTEEIPTLTNTARKVLRDVFLKAEIGISGVNFGVAESGALCIVTNEGNGRMVTTLPKVHIALMGMERLLPSLDDLALMLSLLPRSATGQKMSVYTQIINQPLPGQTRHLVLLDNGRSAMRASPLREALYCIRCGACLNACPVFREIGGHSYRGADGEIAPYPGPIGSVISPGLLGENFVQLAQVSSLCGACQEACPVDIDLPKLLLRVRAGKMPSKREKSPAEPGLPEGQNLPEGQGLPSGLKFALSRFSRLAAQPALFAASQKVAGGLLRPFPQFLPAPAVSGWGFSKDFPKPAALSFRERWKTLKDEAPGERLPADFRPAAPEVPPAPAENRPLLEKFIAELGALSASAERLAPGEAAPRLAEFLRERGIERVQVWQRIRGLNLDELRAAGIRLESEPAPEIAAGLTGALCAIAESGTLLLPGEAETPLTASLLPPLHLVVLPASQIVATLAEALALPPVKSSPALTLVTGPSRTADIEMALTIGVHGPGELRVFVIDDSTAG
ncbi:MAG: hypothetical protein OHK0031_05000 [Anaerolineales bacterium]